MNITQERIDDLNAVLKINVAAADYQSQVEKGLKNHAQKVNMPGFRPGKVPMGMVKKMYGRNIMVEELNKVLSDGINNYLKDNDIKVLGFPIPKDNANIDVDNNTDFDFEYEMGLSPEVSVDLNKMPAFDYEVVNIDQKLLDKYLADIKKNYGKPSNPEVSEKDDYLFVDLVELDANNEILAGGLFKSTSLNLPTLKSEAAKRILTGINKESKITVASSEIFPDKTDLKVSLGLTDEQAETFNAPLQITVRNIMRMQEAEMNQELFDKIYGPGVVESEEAFLGKVKEEMAGLFGNDSDRKMFSKVVDHLIDTVNPPLPDTFLKKWIRVANEKPVSSEQVEKDYPSWAKSMKWKLIENELLKDKGLKVTYDEAKDEAMNYVRAEYKRYGQMETDDKDIERIALSIISKEAEAQKIYDGLYERKLMQVFKTDLKLNTKEVPYDEFFNVIEHEHNHEHAHDHAH
jgi:trigger factor